MTQNSATSFVTVDDALTGKKFRVGKLDTSEYDKSGRFPIIDQGQTLIAGYTDCEDLVYDGPLPVVIFGDHTRALKFVDQRFVAGADGTKVLVPDTTRFDPLYFYFALSGLDVPSRGYNRHWSLLREMRVACPPLDEQRRIARVLSTIQRAQETSQAVWTIGNDVSDSIRNAFSAAMASWPLVSLEDIATVRTGATPPTESRITGPVISHLSEPLK